TDRRIEHLTLTRTGRKGYDALTTLLKTREAELLNRLSEKELETVGSALAILDRVTGRKS
ncbi:MAG: MarR family transcriptional regulator, partial [Oricola sp.]|nr:MarR family transcriptional regulator [Oricola sp.]